MLKSKLKRKIAVDRSKSNGTGSKEADNAVESESDYESDQVILVFMKTCA